MNDVGLNAVLFFVRPVAGALGVVCVAGAQLSYRLFNWAGDRLRRK